MNSHGPSASPHRDGRLVVCRLGSDAVQTANRTIENVSRQVVTANRAATPAPRITEMVSVQDRETKALHLLLVHRLDYRPQGASAVGDVVVFSEPTYAVFRTERLRRLYSGRRRGGQPGREDEGSRVGVSRITPPVISISFQVRSRSRACASLPPGAARHAAILGSPSQQRVCVVFVRQGLRSNPLDQAVTYVLISLSCHP